MRKFKYRSETADQSAVLSVPEGFDPPPVLTVPLDYTYGSGVEVFELLQEESNN